MLIQEAVLTRLGAHLRGGRLFSMKEDTYGPFCSYILDA